MKLSRRMLSGIVLAAATMAITPAWTFAETAASAVGGARLPFGPGEDCRFVVKFGVIKAGSANLKVESSPVVDGHPSIKFISTAESSRFFSTFFKVQDRVESVWSLLDGRPLRFRKDIHEGKYEKQVDVRFDRTTGNAVYDSGDTIAVLPYSQDVLSAFYYIRTQPLAPGLTVAVPNHADGKNYPLEVKVIRRETIQVQAGKFNCVVVEPLLKTAGLFKQDGRLTIWMTDDARRIPVLMKSKVAVGSIIAELTEYRAGSPLAVMPTLPPSRSQGE